MEEGNKVWEVTRSHSNVGFKPKSISCRGPLHLMTSSGYSHSGFVWVFSLGKGQIIHSWKHSFLLTDFSRFFERQADLLGTLLLDKPAPLVLSSAQQTPSYEQRLSISGYPWTMLYSGSVLDWSPILTAVCDPGTDPQISHLSSWVSLSPIISMQVFSPSLQNGMESNSESLRNFCWPCLSFTLAP